VPRSELPRLPPEFASTSMGTPLWIAHPGSTAQYRAPGALHAYELESGHSVHRDRFDPSTEPVRHVLFEAPEVPLAAAAACLAGVGMYLWLDGSRSDEEEKDEGRWWRVLLSAIFAIAVGFIVYLFAALVRVRIG
jgi:hypothetical protein